MGHSQLIKTPHVFLSATKAKCKKPLQKMIEGGGAGVPSSFVKLKTKLATIKNIDNE